MGPPFNAVHPAYAEREAELPTTFLHEETLNTDCAF